MKKVAYLIVQEEITNPIIQSQVINVLKDVYKKSGNRLLLVFFYRIELFRNLKKTNELRAGLKFDGIDSALIPFLSWRFPVNVFWVSLVIPQLLIGLVYIVRRYGIETLHCRSYNAGLIGAILKKFFDVKVIFDPRSPYPEENAAAGKWSEKGINFRFWKRAEAWIARESDTVIAISKPFSDYFLKTAPGTPVQLIPNNYFENTGENEKAGRKLNDEAGKYGCITLCYIGSLGQWNDPGVYLDFLSRLISEARHDIRARFIVMPGSMNILEKAIGHSGLDKRLFEVKHVLPEEVNGEISDCTAGLQLMKHEDDRLGIKVVEYLAAGLPVIVSKNVKGAAHVVETNDVGYIIDPDFADIAGAIGFIDKVLKDRIFWRDRCQTTAKRMFSTESVSERLLDLYEQVSI